MPACACVCVGFFFFFGGGGRGADAAHVYVGAWVQCCLHSLINTQTIRRALTASVDICAEIQRVPLQWRNHYSGRVWRKVPESDARSVT